MSKASAKGGGGEEGESAELNDAPPPTRWATCFEAVLKAILRDYSGQDAKIRDGMASGMRKLFQKPYQEELGVMLAKRTASPGTPLSLEEAQRIVFFPRLSDMQLYADVFRLDTPEATKRREKLMKIKLLSIFYTLHRRDGALTDRFMHCGGLDGLTYLLADDNPVIQSEAVELLMEMLSPQMRLPTAASARQAHLHHQVYLCLRSNAFWKNFAAILGDPADRFPRSHEHSLRILAGAVGWLRPEAGAIPETKAPPNVAEAATALQSYLAHGKVPPDIRGIGEDLLSELLDVPKVREDPLEEPELSEARRGLFETAPVLREDAAHAWQALRRLGNEAFGAGLLWPAEAAYRMALEEGSSGGSVPDHEASLICSNRALVLLKAGHPAEAAQSAAAALARDPRNAKAAFRRAQGLLEQVADASGGGEPIAASPKKLLEEAVAAAELAASLEPKDAKVSELLAHARKQLEELAAQADPEAAVEEDTAQVLDEMD